MAGGGHQAVMLEAVVERLAIRPGGWYVDATLGSGGHAAAIMGRAGPAGRLLGIDRDPEALARATARLRGLPGEAVLVRGDHGELAALAAEHGFGAVDGVLMDTGVSSEQLDTPGRGFSFRLDGPLDMRMGPDAGETAAELLARLEVRELADLFRALGEEPRATRVARAIARQREKAPIATTGQLAEIVTRALGGGPRRGGRHPATRVFQALRMAVNDELGALERALEAAMALLRPDGRLAVICFESLSDRIVKRRLAAHVGRRLALPQGGTRWEGEAPAMAWVERRAARPAVDETAANPRARSARLRVARRLTLAEERLRESDAGAGRKEDLNG